MRRPDYQNLHDNLEEITDKRNAEVRAWGKKVLADADALLTAPVVPVSDDWDLIEEEPVEEEPIELELPPELQEQIEQQIADVQGGKTVPKPRTKPKPATS